MTATISNEAFIQHIEEKSVILCQKGINQYMAKEKVLKSSIQKFSIATRLALLLGVIACIVYANTLQNGYALDDFIVIKNNTIVTRGISAIPELLSTPYHRGHSIINNDLYRPLAMVMFAAEYQLFDGSPTASHLINILVFSGCVILLFLFFDALFERKKTALAFIATLLFALHPIHTEVVANIKSRDELLCFFFSFAALMVFIKYTKAGSVVQLLLGALSFFLALLAKETAITFVVIIPFVFFFYLNEDKKKSGIITAAAIGIAALYLAIRFSVLSKYNANHSADVTFIDNILAGAPTASQKVATAISILGNYLKLLFVPYPLICDYSYKSIPFVNWGSIRVILPILAYAGLATLGIFRLIKNRKDALAFGILFFLITLSLFSNIPFLIGAAMAERFLFFASAGFCLAIALVINKYVLQSNTELAFLKSGKALMVLLPICLLYAVMTIARNSDWKDNTTLFQKDIVKSPDNSRMQYYLGTAELISAETEASDAVNRQQLTLSGIEHLKKSLSIYPGFALVNSELGNAYFNIKNYDSSQLHYERALTQNPTDTLAIHNLSGVYYFLKKYRESIMQCRKAIAIDPYYGRGYRNMGSCYMRLEQYDSAIYVLRSAIVLDPAINSSYQNIAYSFKLIGNMDSARKYEAIARQRNPAFSIDANTQ